ncbi:energy-coupling factor ABC transporter ATP-binding protein [Bombilactobacillus bombi]|uniref:energy-coupling factor ABC transporter ATP-binding protein n=1 Tax=Bombilactobacillus bombi TaxID=1303590 RepID=UPI0015E59DB2|nr:ATP-binding cassette domain-containing protein [Bombilactobacillus bombi]
MKAALLEVRHLQYVAEQLVNLELETTQHEILHDLNFAIKEHEFVGLVGPNGSGKTTLSKLLTRILEPTSGQILLNGVDYQEFTPQWQLHQQVSLVFQNVDAQFIGANFQEDMALYLGNFGWTPAQIHERMQTISQQLGLSELIDQPFKRLSGGQKQLLAIAEALAVQPKLLILDEPTAQLDPENTQQVLQILQKLQQQDVTILLITHKLAELALTKRVLLLNAGQITQTTATANLLTDSELLRVNQLPVPDTLQIAEHLSQLTEQQLSLSNPEIPELIRVIQERLC